MQRSIGLYSGHCSEITAVHCRSIISSHRQTRARLVPPRVQEQPTLPIKDCDTRPHRSHGSLDRCCNKITKRGSTPPCCCCTSQGGERYKGIGPSPPNGPVSHPGGKRHQRNLDSDLAAIHLHCFLNARNETSLKSDCYLTYTGHNIYLPTSFFQALIQGHFLAIPDTDTPTGLLPILAPPSYAGPVNAHQREMRVQVLLSMGQDCLLKEESGELLGHRFHILTTTQELQHSTKNFVKLVENCLG